MRATVFLLSVCLVAFWAAGCKRKVTTPAVSSGPGQMGPWEGGPPDGQQAPQVAYNGPFTAGHKVFTTQGCTRCHAVGGQGMAPGGPGPGGPPPGGPGGPGGRRMGGKGPDLGAVGAKHEKAWITEHVRNPRAHKQQSRMPSFDEGKINATDLDALGDYLASLKGQ
jgi:mono/diheme cytochrome c family protein